MPPTDPPPAALPRHFYFLDALRGLAALGVVCWHWQHFFFRGTSVARFDTLRQPFYDVLGPFYRDGGRAVELFFCLSGFIFFWLYAGPIQRRETSWKEFAALRFSRLYPLHFATLLIVAAGQWLLHRWRGAFFVYPYNDPYHFFLQLFLASNWGFQEGPSFNHPIWSVSIEVLCYAVFFVVCRLNSCRGWQVLAFVCAGVFLKSAGVDELGSGVLGFFAGGLAFLALTRAVRWRKPRFELPLLTVFTALLWVVVPADAHSFAVYRLYRDFLWRPGFDLGGKDVLGAVLGTLDFSSFGWLLFPVTIVTVALWEVRLGTLAKTLAPLGQLSYSAYLLHFPLQLVFFGVAAGRGLPNRVFYSPWVMGLFFLLLIPLSLASYRYFERPCQQWLRDRLLPRAADRCGRAPADPAPAGIGWQSVSPP